MGYFVDQAVHHCAVPSIASQRNIAFSTLFYRSAMKCSETEKHNESI